MADILAVTSWHHRMALQKLEDPLSPSKRVRLRVWRQAEGATCPLPPYVSSPSQPLDRCRSKSLDSFDDDMPVRELKSLTPSPSMGRKRRKLSFDSAIFSLLETTPELLANEITCIDLPLFQAIPREELLEGKWTSKQKAHVSPKIVAFTEQFNQISFWVMKEIINRRDLKARAECLSYFIRLAKKLLDLNNINSVVAIVSALQSAPIFRLKRTWAEIVRKEKLIYQRLQNLLTEDENRKHLRHYMDNMKSPCIPYLGIFLTDLTYLSTAKAKAADNVVDDIHAKLLAIADRISKWQMSMYTGLVCVKPVRDYLKSVQYLQEFTKFMEDDLFRASLKVEPDVSPASACSLPPSPATSRRLTLPASYGGAPPSPVSGSPKIQRKSVAICVSPAKISRQCDTLPAMLSTRSAHSGGLSAEAPAPYSAASQKALGHRRARSYDSKFIREGLGNLSVIDTEAKPGPRHLIDDSLIIPNASSTSSSTGDSGIGKLSPVTVPIDPVVGMEVCQDSESGAESEGLLDDADLSESGSTNTTEAEDQVDLLDATMAGMLKRRTYRIGSRARVKRWRNFYVAVCDLSLAFYRKAPKKHKGRATPLHVINLADCTVADTVMKDKPKRFQMMYTPCGKVFTFKAGSPEQAQEWLDHIQLVMAPLQQQETPQLLMTFEEEGMNTKSESSTT